MSPQFFFFLACLLCGFIYSLYQLFFLICLILSLHHRPLASLPFTLSMTTFFSFPELLPCWLFFLFSSSLLSVVSSLLPSLYPFYITSCPYYSPIPHFVSLPLCFHHTLLPKSFLTFFLSSSFHTVGIIVYINSVHNFFALLPSFSLLPTAY